MTSSHQLPVSPLVDRLIALALEEDIGHGDITTEALLLRDRRGGSRIIANEPMVVAGLPMVAKVYEKIDGGVAVHPQIPEGHRVEKPGAIVAELAGSLHSLLLGERIALNFLQRLSGIATHVRGFVDGLSADGPRIVDTRKTVPGWRVLEKYAVRVGGAHNHRMGLYDGVLIKDNHIAACGGIEKAVAAVRGRVSHLVRIEVEAETLEQVEEALAAGADVIMLDNMDDASIARAAKIIGRNAEIEVSGRVGRQRLETLRSLGINIVSVGALVHAARFVDLSMQTAPAG